ncbi:AT-hook motif nuclear-localized protein 13-like isoform X2 [Brassica napus]|uniref:AT-hook motif nuclear-localized protein 13-like isoform X2 n=1 Tax=Brassica napus TaxID=3708 RepID=UPI000BBECFDC|nr:AT-hook motif nuclear-localized protein 13-like isoform X2 [Brassica napus]
MDSKETQQQQNRNAAAPLAGPTSTSQAMHNRSDLRQPQPQPDPLVLDGAPNSLPVQQPWMLLGVEQLARARARAYAPPDGGDSGGGANAGPPARGGEEGSLTAHVININAGEDIAAKLVAFMNQEPRHVCVLSALGDVSIAELQSNNSLGLVKYEGPYVITNMSDCGGLCWWNACSWITSPGHCWKLCTRGSETERSFSTRQCVELKWWWWTRITSVSGTKRVIRGK